MALALGSIVDALGGQLHGDPAVRIEGLAPIATAGPEQISFLSNPKLQPQLAACRAACVIVAPAAQEAARARGACIVADDPYLYYARLTQLWKRAHAPARTGGVHPSAVVDAEAEVHPTAWIGPLCVVERGARVGAGTVLTSRVTIGERCVVGERCTIQPGAVIGGDGFGFAPAGGHWEKIEQLGAVCIGNDVDIGANTCIDRGALGDTVIEDGVKLDNLIQIAHNVRIGRHSAMAGCSAIAGSTTVGEHCTIGGAAVVTGHATIADHVHIGGGASVTGSVRKAGAYGGVFPLDEFGKWEKAAATLRQLPALRERLRALERQAAARDQEKT
ncbi:UDP-3-O-(3-hydroxymyristoyl)glucosamine N-acyltransferase [Pseudorhodoferax sp.]|uniref:UDP-3-O-(3-hydroxymyristoyl)glucosamine N-acyltransferase n=1 Tax=Pseudorhodoferax sp. TaxID=1993553 RepID=UPI0039E23C29